MHTRLPASSRAGTRRSRGACPRAQLGPRTFSSLASVAAKLATSSSPVAHSSRLVSGASASQSAAPGTSGSAGRRGSSGSLGGGALTPAMLDSRLPAPGWRTVVLWVGVEHGASLPVLRDEEALPARALQQLVANDDGPALVARLLADGKQARAGVQGEGLQGWRRAGWAGVQQRAWAAPRLRRWAGPPRR
jgi:hypothetical protein